MKLEQLPLLVLRVLKPYLENNNDLYRRVDSKEGLLRFESFNDKLGLYFELQSCKMEGSALVSTISTKPISLTNSSAGTMGATELSLKKMLDNWIGYLEEYILLVFFKIKY